jgi:hypothetical protein
MRLAPSSLALARKFRWDNILNGVGFGLSEQETTMTEDYTAFPMLALAFFQLLWAEVAPVPALPVPSKKLIIIILSEYNNANH